MELKVTTKQSDLGWGGGSKDSEKGFGFKQPGTPRRLLESSDREVPSDLINSAKEKYLEHGTSRVAVHLTTNHGTWAKAVTKSRRALSTLVLPAATKEMILADAQDSGKRGIPYRRGYLLYGAPGTGKSSTVHAIVGELGLEVEYLTLTVPPTPYIRQIYLISLANPEINDYTLERLISDTPCRSILLLEDFDCVFPSLEEPDEDEDEEPRRDRDGNIIKPSQKIVPAKSAVTLSGLLNVLDSVSSEEGRLTFATTNDIENLDVALIRAGRMDLKIKYSLATTAQIKELFRVF
ncbi:P-loop containing nucleoside triphosphate hydrolase protein [Mycena rebaudengoi]|nr:P-loop containing nucleoside triphosphate hydrolase protein [Mycena rebaudengoi]